MTGRPSTKAAAHFNPAFIDLLDKTRPNGGALARLTIHDRERRPSKQKDTELRPCANGHEVVRGKCRKGKEEDGRSPY